MVVETNPSLSGDMAAAAWPAYHGPSLVLLPVLVSQVSEHGQASFTGRAEVNLDCLRRCGTGQLVGRLAFGTAREARHRASLEPCLADARLRMRDATLSFHRSCLWVKSRDDAHGMRSVCLTGVAH